MDINEYDEVRFLLLGEAPMTQLTGDPDEVICRFSSTRCSDILDVRYQEVADRFAREWMAKPDRVLRPDMSHPRANTFVMNDYMVRLWERG